MEELRGYIESEIDRMMQEEIVGRKALVLYKMGSLGSDRELCHQIRRCVLKL